LERRSVLTRSLSEISGLRSVRDAIAKRVVAADDDGEFRLARFEARLLSTQITMIGAGILKGKAVTGRNFIGSIDIVMGEVDR
jgi:hypothetical protein